MADLFTAAEQAAAVQKIISSHPYFTSPAYRASMQQVQSMLSNRAFIGALDAAAHLDRLTERLSSSPAAVRSGEKKCSAPAENPRSVAEVNERAVLSQPAFKAADISQAPLGAARGVKTPVSVRETRPAAMTTVRMRAEAVFKSLREGLARTWSVAKRLFRQTGDFGSLLQGNLTVLQLLTLLGMTLYTLISQWLD